MQLEMVHHQTSCFAECYVSPRRSRNKISNSTRPLFESVFLNIAMRDSIKIEKIRSIKVVQALIHKTVFIFYT